MTEAVTALVFDAREAMAGAAQFDAAGKRIIDSNTAVVTATTRTQASIDNMDRALARVQRQIDPVAAAQQRMVAQTTLLDRALQRGKVSAEEHARSVALVQQRYEASVQAAQRATASLNGIVAAQEGATRGSGRFGQAMGQAGFQVQDFATQVAMGQNALLAFGVQFAQFAGIFGTAGAIAGAVVTVGVLGAQFLGAGSAADTLGDAVRAVSDNYGRLNDAAERRQAGMADEAQAVAALTAEYTAMGLAAARAESLIVERRGAALDLESGRMRELLEGSVSDRVRQRLNPRDAFNEAGEALGLARPDEALAGLASALARVQSDAGGAMQAMRDVAAEADRLAQAGGSSASSFARLRNAALDLLPAAGQLDTAQRQLAVQTLATAQAAGAGDEAMRRYAERFGALGNEIMRTAQALTTLRRINAQDPFADIDQDAARAEAQLAALRRGGLEALEATQNRQAVERAGAEANRRVFDEQLAALRQLGATQEEAERGAAAAAQAAQTRAEQGVAATQALTREQAALERATRDAGREARTTGAAFAALRDQESADDLARNIIVRNLGNAAQRQRDEEEQAARRAAEAMERQAEQSAQNISRYLSDGFTDAFVGGQRGFAGMLQSLQRLAISTPVRVGVEAFVSPIAKSLSAGLVEGGGLPGLLGFTEAGSNISSRLNLGGGGGISGLLRTPIGASYGSTATLGSAIGGIGGGFALGSVIGGFTAGDSRARQQNSQIGSGGGALAGAAIGSFIPGVGTVIGGLVGGALGGGLGGLIGPGKGFAGGDAWAQLDSSGMLQFDGAQGKGFDTDPIAQQLRGEVQQLNQAIKALGLRFAPENSQTAGQFGFATIGGGDSGHARSLAEALERSGQFRSLTGGSANVQQAMRSSGSLEEALQAAQWVQQVYEPMARSAEPINAFGDAITELRKPFDEAIAQAQKYGLATDALSAAQMRAQQAAERARFRQVEDIGTDLWMRSARAGGNRAEILGRTQRIQAIDADRQRFDLNERLTSLGGNGPWEDAIRASLETTLKREAEALAREFEKLARDQRVAAESLTSRITRANSVRGGNARDLQQADLYDFDIRARVEVDALRDSLRELGLASNSVEAEVTRLIQAHTLERQAIIDAYAERRRLVTQSLDDRIFAASNDNSTQAGALAAFDRAAQAERLDAAKAGIADMVQLERVLAAERGKIIQDFARQTREALTATGGSIRAFLNELRTGEAAGASPQDRLLAAQRQFGDDLALARGGDADALSRITGTASSLLAASRDMNASGSEYQAMLRLVETSLAALPATRSYDAMVLEELRKLGGAVNVEVDLAVIRAITETLNALPDADRARLVQAQTVVRSIEEEIGRALTNSELESLVRGGRIDRSIFQAMGRNLSEGERRALVEAARVERTVEQSLGRQLTAAERNLILLPGDVPRSVTQAVAAPTGAAVVSGGAISRDVRQAVETTETVQISRSVDEKIGAQLFVHAALLSEVVRGTFAVAQNTAGLLNRQGGVGITSFTDPTKEQLYFRFRANANAILQRVFADKPGDDLLGFDDLLANRGQLFATGGAFTNGIVRRATSFATPDGGLGTMGEAGPEAILPLRQMSDGSLGVQAVNPMAGAVAELRALRAEMVAVKGELAELRRGQAGQTAVIAEAGTRQIAGTRQLVETAREAAATQRLATARPAA
jgi:hypothetical protein